MNLITRRGQHDPLTMFEDFFNDMFTRPQYSMTGLPLASRARMDLVEKADTFEVEVDLPGVNKDDIQVDIQGNRVSISAQSKSEKEQKEGDRVLYSERYAASYARSFDLPQDVDDEKSEATFENGVLKLTLPKRAASANKRLEIH